MNQKNLSGKSLKKYAGVRGNQCTTCFKTALWGLKIFQIYTLKGSFVEKAHLWRFWNETKLSNESILINYWWRVGGAWLSYLVTGYPEELPDKKAAHTGEKDTQCDHFSPWTVFLALKWEDQSQAMCGKLMRAAHCVRLICWVNSGSKAEQHAPYHTGWNMKDSMHDFYLLLKNKLKFKIYLIFN